MEYTKIVTGPEGIFTAISRLCRLQETVARHLNNYSLPNDCFCRDKRPEPADFRSSLVCISFIESAVRDKIAKEKNIQDSADSEQSRQPLAPPLGVMPEFIWRSKRCDDLSAAIVRYLTTDTIDDGYSTQTLGLLLTWTDEMSTHLLWLKDRKERQEFATSTK